MGQKLVLPKWLEPDRIYIEKVLPSLKISNMDNNNSIVNSKVKENKPIKMSKDTNLNFIHRVIPSSRSPGKEYPTLLLLHGT